MTYIDHASERKVKQRRANVARNKLYLMENSEENLRLERKTQITPLKKQALWCGVKPGMRVLDAGCGPGKTTALLHKLLQPSGSILGVDYSESRIAYAKGHYGITSGIDFRLHDLRDPMKEVGLFDLIWVRFVLEYNREESFEIVKNLSKNLHPRGLMCLIDLDYNCLTHFGLSEEMDTMIARLTDALTRKHNFDPYVGRKLYSYLYDLRYEKVDVDVRAHHLFYGKIGENDLFNWIKKAEMATQIEKKIFGDYPGGDKQFLIDFEHFFTNPKRFTYTPVIICKGLKPF